jgi:hypothetical protein
MKDKILHITENSIIIDHDKTVMHRWEEPIMQKKAQWVCSGGGDIIEFGFGMGISAGYIQQHKINSHTICEIHPQVLENLYEWAKTRDNVIVLEGDWYDNQSKMKKYDGILFDTHHDKNVTYFFTDFVYKISRESTKLTWWNNFPQPYDSRKPLGTMYEKMEVNPPPNDYFNSTEYYLPKFEFSSR